MFEDGRAGNEGVQYVPDNACFVATVCSIEDVIVLPIRLGVADLTWLVFCTFSLFVEQPSCNNM